MIFVTVGTNEAAFDRLLRAVDDLPRDEEIVVQYGSSRVRPRGATGVDFLPFDELTAQVRRARVVVTHAGVGSIMVALGEGKRPIVIARSSRLGEAVDDHQVTFGRHLAERGLVTFLEHESELVAAVASTQEGATRGRADGSRLADELAAYLRAVVDGRRGV